MSSSSVARHGRSTGILPRLADVARAARALLGGVGTRLLPRPASSTGREDGRLLNSGGNRGDGPPDLDELWRDFNRKLSGLIGGKGGGGGGQRGGGGGGDFQPDMKSAGIGVGLIAGVIGLIWLGSGFFIVQEGQQAVVMTFGSYTKTVEAGFQWRLPYPFQSHETVAFTQLRTREVGRSSVVQATGLRDSSMLTRDENIVDIRFTVQYRLADTRKFLFENRDPDEAVTLAAESAVREIVGGRNMDSVLYEQRDEIALQLMESIQSQLDRLNSGIQVANVNLQSVLPPEQVEAAFEDAVKAGADRERLKNEGQAYANSVVPQAQGTAARLREEAQGYKARVVSQAEGDGERFTLVFNEYRKAPTVTRDRMYLDAMEQVYASVSKVLVDSRDNSNLLYLPLDKLMQQAGATTVPAVAPPSETGNAPPGSADARSRDNQRSRARETR